MKKAVQQMMLGSICNDEFKTLEVLKKIKETGYAGIELNSYMIHPTSFFVQILTKFSGMPSGNLGKYDWPKLLKDSNLEAISIHTDLDSLENNLEIVIEDANKYNVKDIIITGLYNYPYHKKDSVLELAKRLNEAGKKLLDYNLNLLYHNHNIELVKVDNNKTVYDFLLENTDSKYVNFEIDTYWLVDAGANPLDMMKKLDDRMKYWHITDRGIRIEKQSITPIVKYDSVELGYGNIDLDSLFNYAKEKDIKAVVLESHKNWINNNPLDSIILSSNYLNNKL